MSKTSKHILIEGKVQGVSFRAFSQEQAQKYDIKGWVRNLEDGRVEALASGDEGKLNDFLEALKKGPIHASVENIKINDCTKKSNFTEFTIQANGENPIKNL